MVSKTWFLYDISVNGLKVQSEVNSYNRRSKSGHSLISASLVDTEEGNVRRCVCRFWRDSHSHLADINIYWHCTYPAATHCCTSHSFPWTACGAGCAFLYQNLICMHKVCYMIVSEFAGAWWQGCIETFWQCSSNNSWFLAILFCISNTKVVWSYM